MKKPKIKKQVYPTMAEVEAATLEQLETWVNTLTYPGHSIRLSSKKPREFGIAKARQQRVMQAIHTRIDTLKLKLRKEAQPDER